METEPGGVLGFILKRMALVFRFSFNRFSEKQSGKSGGWQRPRQSIIRDSKLCEMSAHKYL